MPERGYRRNHDPSVYTSDRDSSRERRRERERERRRRKEAHASTDSSADLLAEAKRRHAARYQDSPESSRSPAKRGYYRDESSPEKRDRHTSDREEDRERRRRHEERKVQRRRQKEERDRTQEEEPMVEVVEYGSDSGVKKNRAIDRNADRKRRRRRESTTKTPDRDHRAVDRHEEEGHQRRRSEARTSRQDDERRRLVDVSESSHRTTSTTRVLSVGGLAALDALNEKLGYESGPHRVREEVDESEARYREEKRTRKEEKRRRRKEERLEEKGPDVYDEYVKKEKRYEVDYVPDKRRVVSGQRLEKGASVDERRDIRARWWRWGGSGGSGGSTSSYTELSFEERQSRRKRRRKTCLIVLGIVILLGVAIAIGVIVSKKETKSTTAATDSNGTPTNSNLKGVDPNSVPSNDKGGWLDPFSWYDTNDFNVTYTNEMVGGLPVIGLNSSWDDSTRANDQVPPLDQAWSYGKMPIRGINLGGWLVNEPLITPSFYSRFKSSDNVVDEYTLAAKLPPGTTKSTFEQHYSSFVSEGDVQAIQAAGFDHIRIPFGYWAVTTYDGDPYVSQVSWRYLLRAIEWARKYGLRVNLDLHGLPGSQNGWNHSGRQGEIGWLNGTNGALNGKRSLDIHNQLSTFFAQPRYKNIIAFYGLANEPRMTALDTGTVLQWTRDCYALVRQNGINATIVFGDGFMGLDKWQGQLQDLSGLVLDVHQYVIFNVQQLTLDHSDKVNFACGGWSAQATRSQNKATGFGPTMFAEWSQADTDCATYLNNVGVGSRWEGTLNMINTPGGSTNGSVLTPTCPTNNNPRCSCKEANADPGSYSDTYKQWLRDFGEAQMESFELGWGWFYWTWKTETATQWSYKDGMAAGILPERVWERSFNCGAAGSTSNIPDYAGLGLPEYY